MGDEVQRLVTVWDAKFDKILEKMDKLQRSIHGSADKIDKRLSKTGAAFEGLFGKGDPAKALNKIFDSSRLKILDSGVARIGLFGSALEELGPAGLTAAGAIGAVALAMGEAKAAVSYADALDDTATKLGVTTDALQEFRFAVRAAGGEEAGADEGLQAFSVTLGKAQEGLVKSQKAFRALGFSKEEIKGFQTVDQALQAVTGRIAGLKSEAQKAAIIDQLGLTGMKPLIEQGVTALNDLRAKAHEVGVVMDAELIKRAAPLQDEFETASKAIKLELMSAFVDLAPAMLRILEIAKDIAHTFAGIIAAFQTIENRSTQALLDQRATLTKEITRDGLNKLAGRSAGTSDKALQSKNDEVARIDAILAGRAARAGEAPPVPKGNSLIDQSPHTGPTAQEKLARGREALDEALRNELQAQQALTEDVEELARLKSAEVDKELARKNDRLAAEIAARKIDEGLATQAMLANKRAAEEQKDLIKREADWALEDRADEIRKQIHDAELEILNNRLDLARSTAERRDLERQILAIQQSDKLHDAGKALSRQVETGAINQGQADQAFNAVASTLATERAASEQKNLTPLQSYLKTIPAGIDELNDAFSQLAADGLESLSTGIADAIMNAKDLGDVTRNVFRQILSDVIAMTIRQDIVRPAASFLTKFIPHFAGGTDSAPGGLSLVGENGPELINLPRGSRVIPNHALRAATAQATNGVRESTVVVQPFHFHAEGAVMTADLLAQADRMAQLHAARAFSAADSSARRGLAANQRRMALLGKAG